MTSVVVMGAGPAGLSTAMLLSKEGFEVTVLEKDPSEPPNTAPEAWSWKRPGVSQFRQAHTILPRGRAILEEQLPGVLSHLEGLGAIRYDLLDPLPPSIGEWTPSEGDDRFWSLGARRPTYELAFALAAGEVPTIDLRRGVAVEGLMTGPDLITGVPHITGVVTDQGERISADLVVDAGGRRSPLPRLLEEVGADRVPERSEDSRFVYYTRFYRKPDGGDFPQPYTISLYSAGSISILTIPGDNDTWSTTLYATTSDKAMRAVKDPDVFERVVRAHPLRAVWVEGDALTDIEVMAGISDRERPLFVDDLPVTTGIVSVGDAWACTNPSLGRGISMGLMHVASVLPTLIELMDKPVELAREWRRVTSSNIQPWHEATLITDWRLNSVLVAIGSGEAEPDHIPSVYYNSNDPDDAAFYASMMTDQRMFRVALEMIGLYVAQDELMARPEVQQKLVDMKQTAPEFPPPQIPSRSELEELLI